MLSTTQKEPKEKSPKGSALKLPAPKLGTKSASVKKLEKDSV
jgi:hypothetical protein